MCGFAGFTNLRGRNVETIARAAADAIVHRGPDEQDVFITPAVGLAAVRLKIQDLTHGHQPMRSDDGRTVIVFNGEVYNHRELRRELEARGHAFHSDCDTEVVLKAFLEWDVASFERLRGMFAVAFWNERERRLVLARDRVGIKPLYYAAVGDDLFFGSELKTLFVHPDVERTLDRTGLSYYLSLNYVPTPYTLVEGIRKLPPGHWMEWRSGDIETAPYWTLRFDPDRSLTVADAERELDHLLRESVREHLLSDVPLGVWLSGGLDSSTILHYAAEASPTPLKTFSVSFSGQTCDESAYFREVARKYGTEHFELDLRGEHEVADAVSGLTHYSDEPSADAGALPVWFLSRLTRQQVTVALTGDGADELFGGYLTYVADGYARHLRRVPAPLRRAALALAGKLPVSDAKISFEYKLKRMLAGSLLPPEDSHFFWNGTFTAREKAKLFPDDPAVTPGGLLDRLEADPGRTTGYRNRFMYVDQHYYLTDDILYKCDRMSMAHSVEVRPPFLDHRIIEFAARLPENFKIRGGSLKWLLRRLMEKRLPQSVLKRRKEGFDIPAHQWFRGPLKAMLHDTLSTQAVADAGLFNPAVVRRMVDDHLERRANHGYHLWGLMTLFQWMERWNIRIETAPEALPSRDAVMNLSYSPSPRSSTSVPASVPPA